MKYICCMLLFSPLLALAQHQWDGGGLDGRWDNPANWQPDGVPPAGSAVLLDNSLFAGSYTVALPAGNTTVELSSMRIAPQDGTVITLILPRENTAAPGLRITGAGESLVLERGAVLRNASGAASGEPLQLLGNFRIENEGHYIHQTPRGNAALIDRLSQDAGTETGIFEFDVPGTAGYTVSLTGNVFGTLAFGATAAGGAKSYSGSGASSPRIRGDWIVRTGATLTTTVTANILLEGSLLVDGRLLLQPSTGGTAGRSLLCLSGQGRIGGSGTLGMQANFREILIASAARYSLGRSITLPLAQHTLRVQDGGMLLMDSQLVEGAGRFTLDAGGAVSLSHPQGISASGTAGQVTTASREFSTAATYRYAGEGNQETGNGLPPQVASLVVDKVGGQLQLSNNVTITDTLNLQQGIIQSSTASIVTLGGAVVVSPTNAFGNQNEGWEGSYVDGPLRYVSSAPGGTTLPVGKADIFAPIRIIRETAGVATYTVEYFPQAYTDLSPVNPASLRKVSSLEYWAVSADGTNADIPARIALSWRPSSNVGTGERAKAELRVGQYIDQGGGFLWDALGTLPQWQASGGFGWLEGNQQALAFQAFTLGSSGSLNLLPLRRLSLQAESRPEHVVLRCLPEGDGICPPLQLERSADGQGFTPLGAPLAGKIYGREISWCDSFPLQPMTYYRVRQTGGPPEMVSPIVRVTSASAHALLLYPNPVDHELVIHFPGWRSGTEAIIVQMDGRQVRQIRLEGEIHRENVSTLPPGRYNLMVKHTSSRVVLPFLKH